MKRCDTCVAEGCKYHYLLTVIKEMVTESKRRKKILRKEKKILCNALDKAEKKETGGIVKQLYSVRDQIENYKGEISTLSELEKRLKK